MTAPQPLGIMERRGFVVPDPSDLLRTLLGNPATAYPGLDQPRHGGDYFRVGDDVLSYATGYDGGLRGMLYRVR